MYGIVIIGLKCVIDVNICNFEKCFDGFGDFSDG